MKAALALIVIYIAAFIIATRVGPNPVQASASGTNVPAGSKSVDPEKEADLALAAAICGSQRTNLQSVASESAAQYREKLSASVKNVAEIRSGSSCYRGFGQLSEEFRPATGSAANRGDLRQAFSDDEIKGLLDFTHPRWDRSLQPKHPRSTKKSRWCKCRQQQCNSGIAATLKITRGPMRIRQVRATAREQTRGTLQDEIGNLSQRP